MFASVVGAQGAAAPGQAELDEVIRQSQQQDKFIPTPASLMKPKKGGARTIEADRLFGVVDKNLTALGKVDLRDGNMILRADRLDYDVETDLATTPGKFEIDRAGDIITGSDLKLKIESEVGSLLNPTFVFALSADRPNQRYVARAAAARMNLETANRERLFGANYTTCKAGENEWSLNVAELALDRINNVGTGFNATLVFKGLPILYVPFMTFPLNNERKTGFLPPTFGSSSTAGFDIAMPYYFNLARNLDATVTPKIYTKRGLQIGGEFRYLDQGYFGALEAEYLPKDRRADRDRFLQSIRHFHNFGATPGHALAGWTASINAQRVSDDAYFRDLSTRIANTAQTHLPRDIALQYSASAGLFSARYLAYQTLQDPLAPVARPYRLAPQVSFNAQPLPWQGLELNAVSEFTAFEHPTLVSGQRWLTYPSATYNMTRSFGFITPKVGLHVTRYDLTGNRTGYESATRVLPILSLDSGLSFERPMYWKSTTGAVLTQTLEPRLFFLDVPFRDQSRLPLFSTSETDFNFAQIFNENSFIGGDRIADAKQVTLAVTTRIIENITGIERLRAAIGQRYYFQPQRVALPNSNNDPLLGISGAAQGTISRSDILAGVAGQVSDHWSLDSSFQYSASLQQFQKSSVGARYLGDAGRLVNLSYRYTRDQIKQFDVSTQWPFGAAAPGFTLLARANHSFRERGLLEALLGVEYNQGCWEMRFVANRFATATQQFSNSFQLQLELKGLSKLGVNPFETIKQNIIGYRRSDDRQ